MQPQPRHTRSWKSAIRFAGNLAACSREHSYTFPSGAVREFTGQSLLLNNSLPNFYFHCTTAYDILRHCGIELGKRDFMGTPVSL